MNTFKKIVSVGLLAAVAAGMNPLAAMQSRKARTPKMRQQDGTMLRKSESEKKSKHERAARLAELRSRFDAGEVLSTADVETFFYFEDGAWLCVDTNKKVPKSSPYFNMLQVIAAHVSVSDNVVPGSIVPGNPKQARDAGVTNEQVEKAVQQATKELQKRLDAAESRVAATERSNKVLKIIVVGSIAVALIGAACVWYFWPAVPAVLGTCEAAGAATANVAETQAALEACRAGWFAANATATATGGSLAACEATGAAAAAELAVALGICEAGAAINATAAVQAAAAGGVSTACEVTFGTTLGALGTCETAAAVQAALVPAASVAGRGNPVLMWAANGLRQAGRALGYGVPAASAAGRGNPVLMWAANELRQAGRGLGF